MHHAPDPLLKAFYDDEGRVKQWPAARKLQLLILPDLADKFTLGTLYTERQVNALLDDWHTFKDAALLRRELFEAGYFNREKDGSCYWRTHTTFY